MAYPIAEDKSRYGKRWQIQLLGRENFGEPFPNKYGD